MIARNVTMRLKPNSVADFTQMLEKEIIPLLRQQKGFQDELAFIVPGGEEAVGISLWANREDAEAYGRDGYPKVLKALEKVLVGTPQVRNGEVFTSTYHKITTAVPA